MINITRYGKLIPVKQEDNFGTDGFHNAPEEYGFYCFNQKFKELFLVGDKIYDRDIYSGVAYDGLIYIHLEPPKPMIIKRVGGWFQVRVKDYQKILSKRYLNEVTRYQDGYTMNYARDHLELFCTKETKIRNVRKGFNKHKHRGVVKSHELSDIKWQKEMDRWEYYRSITTEEK